MILVPFSVALMLLLHSSALNAQVFDIQQTISDGAQRSTIAFDGMAFLTGNFCACTFIPPGKVADYFGFQYVRDNDISGMGHTTDFLTAYANNLLYVLDSAQKQEIISLAKAQVTLVNQYASNRFPLIDAFVRLRDGHLPAGSTGLDKEGIETYSAQLYRLDGYISLQRAQLYARIINALNAQQRNYLDSVCKKGMKYMPVLPDQIDKRPLNNYQFVAVMSIAADIYTWYIGSLEADVYFCPERQGDYFGGFYIKDAPAMGNHGYAIDTNLTQHGGDMFLEALTPSQRALITAVVEEQRPALLALVERRTDIAKLLRLYRAQAVVDTTAILQLSETYGRLDGEISYYYATAFSRVGWTLTQAQRDTLHAIRNLDKYPCVGAYLYSDSIAMPEIPNTDFLFATTTAVDEQSKNSSVVVAPNPFAQATQFTFTVASTQELQFIVYSVHAKVLKTFKKSYSEGVHTIAWDGKDDSGSQVPNGVYYYILRTGNGSTLAAGNVVLLR